MAYVNFDNLSTTSTNDSQKTDGVGFFSLKSDGEEAIVRFMHDSTQSFEILGTHPIQINGKFRRINCVRTPNQPINLCPICAKGENIEYKIYIHLLQYVRNADGSVSVEPKVWERSISYANKLKEYINNYGPMSDVICKIVRHGKPGDMKTEYEIIPNLNKQIYRDDVFVKKTNCFDDFKVLGRIVLDKTSEEINEYLNTGNFPMKKSEEPQNTGSTPDSNYSSNSLPNWNSPSEDEFPSWSVEPSQVTKNSRSFNWTTNDSQQVNRPTRF